MFSVASTKAQSSPPGILNRLTLAQAEDLLIDRNLSVLAAKYQVEANRAARLIASYRPNPTLTLGAEQVPFYSPLAGSYPRLFKTNPDAGANPVYTLRIDQVWERGRKRQLRTSQAEEQLKASEAQMLDALRTQLYQLRQAYTAAILARETLRLAESIDQQYGETENLTQVKVDQGDVAKVEIYRVSAGRLQYRQAVMQAQTAYSGAVRDLLNLMGVREQELQHGPPSASGIQPASANTISSGSEREESINPGTSELLELLTDYDDRPISQNLEQLRSIALSERPDVNAARHLASSAESALQLARAQRTRDVDLGYEYQRVGSDHSVGVVLQIPLFLNNDQRALFLQAEAQKHVIEAQLKQAELQAVTDVDKAYQSYLSARRVLELYNSSNLSQLEALRNVAAVSYKGGASSLLEYLDAQRAYSTAMTSYLQARADYQNTLWQLEQATGRSLR